MWSNALQTELRGQVCSSRGSSVWYFGTQKSSTFDTNVLGTVHFLSGGGGWWFFRGATRKNSDVKGGVNSGKLNFEGGPPKHQ